MRNSTCPKFNDAVCSRRWSVPRERRKILRNINNPAILEKNKVQGASDEKRMNRDAPLRSKHQHVRRNMPFEHQTEHVLNKRGAPYFSTAQD